MSTPRGTTPSRVIVDLDPELRNYAATERQAEFFDLVVEHGNAHAAAHAAGVSPQVVQRAINKMKTRHGIADRQAAVAPKDTPGFVVRELTTQYDRGGEVKATSVREGPEPIFDPGGVGECEARDGGGAYVVKGMSTLFDSTGQQRQQWIKTRLDDVKRDAAIREAYAAMAEDLPRLPPIPPPASCMKSLANLYVITDYHMGMMAWRKEGGADWDLKIAERTLMAAMEHLVSASPPARVGILAQLGDFLHTDGLLPVTPTSGHVLDADGRYSKVVQIAVRCIRRVVDLMLMKHEEVHVIQAEGNHDMASSVWLRILFAALYENEPRVTINGSELPYYVYQHGRTMLGFHHGHIKKKESLPLMFAAQFPEVWGATSYRVVHTGHQHHEDLKEHAGIRVHQHPTLAARDAHAARGGWISERQASCITYHADGRKVGEVVVTPEMLAA